jgi:hypothetical protein
MPRKYKDGEVVSVYYSTRLQTLQFIGKVIGHTDGRYEVLYLCPKSSVLKSNYRWIPQFGCDMVFRCNVYELSCHVFYENCTDFDGSSLEVLTDLQAKMMAHYMQFCRDNFRNYNSPYNDATIYKKRMLYKSFSTKRVLDWALNRVFPVVAYPSRAEYLYA